MTLFEADASGDRTSTRYAPGYFQLIRDFALLGAVPGQYGDAEVIRPRTVAPGLTQLVARSLCPEGSAPG